MKESRGLGEKEPPSSSVRRIPLPTFPRGRELWYSFLRLCAGSLLVCYIVWQIYWLAKGQLPPALFLALTGWPAPTTGGTRAILLLLQEDWRDSLDLNPLAVPMTFLLLFTLMVLVRCLLREKRIRLPEGIFRAWIIVLSVAWIVQLTKAFLTR